ncbi:MAG: ABC transporter substrate-binding protein [Candidatus Pelethousia sp.]|nr:ABC transporter substrate-binding protein [Candidatus Pelethousia sp.]
MKKLLKNGLMLFVCAMMLLTLVACAKQSQPAAPGTAPAEQSGNPLATEDGFGMIVSADPTGIVSSKDSMTVVVAADPGSLDPHDNVQQQKHQSTRQIYETLVVYNDNGELIPWLAESWEYENDLTLVFHIRKGVKFHNGDELKASDVLFSFKRMRSDNTPAAMQVNKVDFDKCEVVDDYTLKLVTSEPYALQLPMLENPLCGIISERSYTESKGDFNASPVGTGPYKVVKFVAGDSLTLEGFDGYWIAGQPYVKHVTLRYINDSSSRAIEAESGGSDIVYEISANDVDRVRENPNINLVSAMGANTSYLYMNLAHAPLDNIKVREAIWYALDVPGAIDVAYGSFGKLADGVISPGIDGRHPDMSAYFPKQDLEKAKALLAEAGFPNGFTTEISCNSSDQQRKDFAEAIQAQLAQVGITLNINVMDTSTFATYLSEGKGKMCIYGLTASTGEAGRTLFRWLPDTSEWPLSSWESQEYYDLISKALVTTDTAARNEMYYRCQEMLMENFIVYPVWHKELNAACQPGIAGFRITPSYEQHYLQFVYFQ